MHGCILALGLTSPVHGSDVCRVRSGYKVKVWSDFVYVVAGECLWHMSQILSAYISDVFMSHIVSTQDEYMHCLYGVYNSLPGLAPCTCSCSSCVCVYL
ncbi:hypothetical protein C8Q74DRAFT_608763 [Fomes fomentarius]|nr:hypothetical protein C8Q74DRAFT_608763 [Fomes fomentarius]